MGKVKGMKIKVLMNQEDKIMAKNMITIEVESVNNR